MSEMKAEDFEIRGKTLKEWALTDPVRLEQMFEAETDRRIANAMAYVYRIYVIEKGGQK